MKKTMVVFFDGVCGLCNGFVDAILKLDQTKTIYFSPLQSNFAKAKLPPEVTSSLESVVIWNQGEILLKSDGVLSVLKHIGTPVGIIETVSKIPKSLRDKVYDFVASNRYEWFGKKDACRIPTAEERMRFMLEVEDEKNMETPNA